MIQEMASDKVFVWCLVVVVVILYFIPTIVSWMRSGRTAFVFVLNLFLGWTFVGWVVALACAFL